MTLSEKLRAIRDAIQVDVGNRGLARDPDRNLVNAYPDDFELACRDIAECPSPSLAVVTGFFIPTAEPPAFETDGPLGAVFLCRVLGSLGIPCAVCAEAGCRLPVLAGLRHSGVDSGRFVTLPTQLSAEGLVSCPEVREVRSSTHVLALERVGPSADGRCYTMRGRDVTEYMAPAQEFFGPPSGREWRYSTIGVGDGGNEIGMGKILPAVIAGNIPEGSRIACRVATDHLVVAGVSNWGAYALAAGVALVRGDRLDPMLFDPEAERAGLQEMIAAGPLVDGVTGKPTATVDGLTWQQYAEPLYQIGQIVRSLE